MRIGALKQALYRCGLTESPLSWDHRDVFVELAKGVSPEVRRAAFTTMCGLLGIDAQRYSGPRP